MNPQRNERKGRGLRAAADYKSKLKRKSRFNFDTRAILCHSNRSGKFLQCDN
jgi:hypothetical protein